MFNQFIVQLQRQIKIKLYEKSFFVVILFVPAILGLISGLVFYGNETSYNFKFNGFYSYFLFMMIITTIFLGLLISIIEIMKEKGIINKEKLFNISIIPYYFSKFLVLSFAGLIQVLILYFIGSTILEVPKELFFDNFGILYLVMLNSIGLGLLVSAFSKNYIIAYNMISVIILPQILLGGGFIPYSNMTKILTQNNIEIVQMPLLSKVMPTSWAYEDIVVTNYIKSDSWHRNEVIEYMNIDEKEENEYMSKEKTFFGYGITTFMYSKLILLFELFVMILITLKLLNRKDSKF